jgi:hypothetical protein
VPETREINGNTATTAAGINSIKLRIRNVTSTADVLIDTVSVKAASYRTPWVHNLAAGSTTANARDYRLFNTLSARSDVLREDMYESGFCASAWVYTDWAGNDGVSHFIMVSPATAGSNNLWRVHKFSDNSVEFDIYDSAGVARWILLIGTTINWSAEDWKYIEVCSENDGTMDGHWYNVANSTWYDMGAEQGIGTGIQDGQSDELHVGHNVTATFCDCYIPVVHIVPYSAIFPLEGFNLGRPPINGRPY